MIHADDINFWGEKGDYKVVAAGVNRAKKSVIISFAFQRWVPGIRILRNLQG